MPIAFLKLFVQILLINLFFANFADDGKHSLAEANVYYTRLAEPIGKLWATNPRPPQEIVRILLLLLLLLLLEGLEPKLCVYICIHIYIYIYIYINE